VATPERLHNSASAAVYLIGALMLLLVASAATWMLVRDYRSAVQNARQHLDNYTVVLAEHTALALRNAPAEVLAAIKHKPAEASDESLQQYMTALYGRLELAYSGRVLLFRSDGTLLTAFPRHAGPAGRSYAAHPLFSVALPRAPVGAIESAGVLDPGDYLFAYRTVKDYPLVVAVSSSMNDVLSVWRRDTLIVGFGALVLAFVTALATFLFGRELRRTGDLTRELSERELRLDSIIGSAMDAIITIDEKQHVVLFNAAAERIFGCSAQEAIGSALDWFIPERFRETHAQHVKRFGESGTTMRRMGSDLVLAGLRANGEEFPIDASISHVDVGGRKFYTVILRDITERQGAAAALNKSHQELSELYESMHQVREAERTRIARELHDELAQWLTALKMDVSWIATRLPREHEELIGKAERMRSVVDSTVAAVRRIAADLRPVMLDDLGLVAALESLLNELSTRAGIEVSLHAEGQELELPEPLATAVYRMVQEALTNVARHARATAVAVDVAVGGRTLHVRVRDNGHGLKPDPDRKSFGLLGIRERARTLGGDARIYSPPGAGTIVEIDIPLQAAPAERPAL